MTGKHKSMQAIDQAGLRELVVKEMGDALTGIALVMPGADGAQALRLCIGYLADCHSRSFGHVETVKALIAITRRGVSFAEEEIYGLRSERHEVHPSGKVGAD